MPDVATDAADHWAALPARWEALLAEAQARVARSTAQGAQVQDTVLWPSDPSGRPAISARHEAREERAYAKTRAYQERACREAAPAAWYATLSSTVRLHLEAEWIAWERRHAEDSDERGLSQP